MLLQHSFSFKPGPLVSYPGSLWVAHQEPGHETNRGPCPILYSKQQEARQEGYMVRCHSTMDWSSLLTGFAAKFIAGTNIFEENNSTMNDFMTLRWEGEGEWEGRREEEQREGRVRGRQRKEGGRKDREKREWV